MHNMTARFVFINRLEKEKTNYFGNASCLDMFSLNSIYTYLFIKSKERNLRNWQHTTSFVFHTIVYFISKPCIPIPPLVLCQWTSCVLAGFLVFLVLLQLNPGMGLSARWMTCCSSCWTSSTQLRLSRRWPSYQMLRFDFFNVFCHYLCEVRKVPDDDICLCLLGGSSSTLSLSTSGSSSLQDLEDDLCRPDPESLTTNFYTKTSRSTARQLHTTFWFSSSAGSLSPAVYWRGPCLSLALLSVWPHPPGSSHYGSCRLILHC